MKKEAQRIAIATAYGFTEIAYSGPFNILCGVQDGVCQKIPDYLNDLNAMRKAALFDFVCGKHMKKWAKRLYCGYLLSIANGTLGEVFEPSRMQWYYSQIATAEQCAEAFLRTLALWKEE